LAFHAAHYSVDHAQDVSSSILERMEQLFDKLHFSAWIWLYAIKIGTPSMENISERQSEPAAAPLYYSAASDLHNLTERLVAIHPNDVHPRESSIWIPLAVAV
jgi:hypothetical protein